LARSPELASDGPPAQQQIAEILRAEILAGKYADGDQLPSEAELVERFGVSGTTVRNASAALQREGLAVSKRGLGVFVRRPQRVVRYASERLSRERWGSGQAIWDADTTEQGRSYSVDSLRVTRESPSKSIRESLDLGPDDDVCVRRRRFIIEGRPVMLATSYLPWKLVEGSQITEPHTGPGGTYARLAELSAAPDKFSEAVLGRMPTPEELTRLDLPPGVPVLEVTRLAWTEDGRPVEVQPMVLDSSYYLLHYNFTA